MTKKTASSTKPRRKLFEPQKGRLLVGRSAEVGVTKGGIFVPDNAKEKPQEGTVLASHPENQYKVGNVLLFARYAGTDVKLNDTILLILPEEEVLGELKEA